MRSPAVALGSNVGGVNAALHQRAALLMTFLLFSSCSGTTQNSSENGASMAVSTTTSAEYRAAEYRRDYELDEANFRTKLFAGDYFLSAEEVGSLVSAEGLYGQIIIDEPKGMATGTVGSICGSLTINDLVDLANPSRASSRVYIYDYEDEAIYNSPNALLFSGLFVAFDVPRDTDLESLSRTTSDSIALSGGNCKNNSEVWRLDETCAAVFEEISESEIPGWYQDSDFANKGCVRESFSDSEHTTMMERATDLYFPDQFFILRTPTERSQWLWVEAHWFLPAEWLGVMLYIRTQLTLLGPNDGSVSRPTAAEVIDKAAGVFKSFKIQAVQALSRSSERPSFEDLHVRHAALEALP